MKTGLKHLGLFVTLAFLLPTLPTLQAGKPPKDPPPPPVDISFTMTLIGTLGGNSGAAFADDGGLNEAGDVTGTSETAAGGLAPFVYAHDTGVTHNLYDLFPEGEVEEWLVWFAEGINGSRQVCGTGYRFNAEGEVEAAATRFTPEHLDELGNVVPAVVEMVGPPGFESEVEDINAFGDVTGKYIDENGAARAFVYTDEFGPVDIGDLGGGTAIGHAVNDFAQVAGSSTDADGNSRAFLFTPGSGMEDLGIIKAGSTGTLGNFSVGSDLSNLGVVVGQTSAGSRKGHDQVRAFRDSGQGLEDLGTLGGDRSWAQSVNSAGQSVGWSWDKDGQTVAFLYTDEFGMAALAPLIVNLPADTETIRTGRINDAGQICGTISFTDGTAQAFLLTPN